MSLRMKNATQITKHVIKIFSYSSKNNTPCLFRTELSFPCKYSTPWGFQKSIGALVFSLTASNLKTIWKNKNNNLSIYLKLPHILALTIATQEDVATQEKTMSRLFRYFPPFSSYYGNIGLQTSSNDVQYRYQTKCSLIK